MPALYQHLPSPTVPTSPLYHGSLPALIDLRQPKPVDAATDSDLDIKVRFSEAVIDVFDSMFSVKLESTDSIPPDSLENIRNVASVSFAGDASGMVSIQIGDTFTRQLTAEVLGMKVEELEGEQEIKDMMGELGNIVGGHLKSAFTDAGLPCALSTPSFTTGTDFIVVTKIFRP